MKAADLLKHLQNDQKFMKRQNEKEKELEKKRQKFGILNVP